MSSYLIWHIKHDALVHDTQWKPMVVADIASAKMSVVSEVNNHTLELSQCTADVMTDAMSDRPGRNTADLLDSAKEDMDLAMQCCGKAGRGRPGRRVSA